MSKQTRSSYNCGAVYYYSSTKEEPDTFKKFIDARRFNNEPFLVAIFDQSVFEYEENVKQAIEVGFKEIDHCGGFHLFYKHLYEIPTEKTEREPWEGGLFYQVQKQVDMRNERSGKNLSEVDKKVS